MVLKCVGLRWKACLRMLPHAHIVPYHTLERASVVRAYRCVVRHPPERTGSFGALRRYDYTALVVRNLLAWLLEQFRVDDWWERPWRAAGGCGLVCGKLETDERAGLGEEGRDALSPRGA